jgi:endonuclease/exonuclease/phosphatase family metal-dependent hydrolase
MPGMVRVYRETGPDIIGLQEVSLLQADLLLRGLLDDGQRYAMLWGKFTPVIYRQDRLELVESEFYTYPEEMDGWDGEFNDVKSKSCSIAVFRDKQDGKLLVFATTHLWWKNNDPKAKNYQAGSDEARVYQLNMTMDRLEAYHEKYGCPVVLVGDLNSKYNSPVIQNALARDFEHAHNIAVEFADEDWGYHYCFGDGYKPYEPAPFEKAIDHILVKYAPAGFVRRFERYTPDYYLPLSDHSPVFADVVL